MTACRARWLALRLALAAIAPMSGPVVFAQGPAAPADAGAAAATPASPTEASPTPTAPVEPGAWHTVTGPEQSFTAELPATPKYTATQMKTATGSLYTVHQYVLEQGEAAYIVQAATYPEDINVANPRTNLQGGLDNLAKSMDGAKWGSVDWLTHQGLTASDAIGARSGHAIRSFSVMKGRQVFTLIFAGSPGTARSADVNRFVGSLRVGP